MVYDAFGNIIFASWINLLPTGILVLCTPVKLLFLKKSCICPDISVYTTTVIPVKQSELYLKFRVNIHCSVNNSKLSFPANRDNCCPYLTILARVHSVMSEMKLRGLIELSTLSHLHNLKRKNPKVN